MLAMLAGIVITTAGCAEPTIVGTAQPGTARFSDVTVDERDLNDEAFDLAWWELTNSNPRAGAEVCLASQINPDAMWLAFDKGAGHTFPRSVWDRGINRVCS